MNTTTFRQVFREFANPTPYPDDAINYWIGIAVASLNAERWSTLLDVGVALFTAHFLVLSARDIAASAAGGVPGDVKGPPTQKAVDKVSQGYDTRAATIEGADHWNTTSYGIRFMRLAKQFGMGGVQLGPVPVTPGQPFIIFPPGFGV